MLTSVFVRRNSDICKNHVWCFQGHGRNNSSDKDMFQSDYCFSYFSVCFCAVLSGMVAIHMKNIKHSMLCVTVVYLTDITKCLGILKECYKEGLFTVPL